MMDGTFDAIRAGLGSMSQGTGKESEQIRAYNKAYNRVFLFNLPHWENHCYWYFLLS